MESLRGCKPILDARIVGCCLTLLAVGLVFPALAVAEEDGVIPYKTTVSAQVAPTTGGTQSLLQPANDECTGAVVIPDGPYPLCSPITTGVQAALPTATTIGTDPEVCLGPGQWMANSIWYTWTPAVTGFYRLYTCAQQSCNPAGARTLDAGGVGSDGIFAMYTSSNNDCDGTLTIYACNDDGCGGAQNSIIGPTLFTGGQKYFIMGGNWTGGSAATAGKNDQYEIRIEEAVPAPNDRCENAIPLTLNHEVTGSINAVTANDYTLPANFFCFNVAFQLGNTGNIAPGRDVAYSFTAPSDGDYSFLVSYDNGPGPVGGSGPNLVTYLLGACDAPGEVTSCLYAANRNLPLTFPTGGTEEIMCYPLTAGQTVYPIVDHTALFSENNTFRIVATRCTREIEFNGTPDAAADAGNSADRGCPVEGTILSITVPFSFQDVDFYTLGTPAAGSRVYAMADGAGANPSSSSLTGVSFDMRITTATDTLEYDRDQLGTFFGGLCPAIVGRELTGVPSYIRIDHTSTTAQAEPYRLYHSVRPPGAGPLGTSATPEAAENNDALLQLGDYFFGFNAPPGDVDYFSTCARKGDVITFYADADPTRDNTPYRNFLIAFDPFFSTIPVSGFGLSDPSGIPANTTPSPGTLTGTTPHSHGNAIVHRVRTTGLHTALMFTSGSAPSPNPGNDFRDYLLEMSVNCKTPSANVSIAKQGPPRAVPADPLVYQICVSNAGPDLATGAAWVDVTPPGTVFAGLTAPDGWSCSTPDPGDAGQIACFEDTACFDGTACFELVLTVTECLDEAISNRAAIFSFTGDPDAANNEALTLTPCGCAGVVCDDGNPCTDDSCDPNTGQCVYVPDDNNSCSDNNACTTVDRCVGGECVGTTPPNCNDGNICTDDSCNPAVGCVSTPNNICGANPKSHGYWKRLCRGPHPSGEFISASDVDCVNDTCTFSAVSSAADICGKLSFLQNWDKCKQAEAQFMGLMLNLCKGRVLMTSTISSQCGPNTTVGQSKNDADARLCDPGRNHASCVIAQCESEEINSGRALGVNSLSVDRITDTVIRVNWQPPYTSPDGTEAPVMKYRVWRRTISESAFTLLAEVPGHTMSYTDATATGSSYQYEVTPVW